MVWRPRTTSRRVCPVWSSCSRHARRRVARRSPRPPAGSTIEENEKAKKVIVTPDDGSEPQEYPVSKRSRLLVDDGDHVEVGQQITQGTPGPAGRPADPRHPPGPGAPRGRGPGGLPLAGRADPRQAHRDHRAADAAPGPRAGAGRHRTCSRRTWWTGRPSSRRTGAWCPRAASPPPAVRS